MGNALKHWVYHCKFPGHNTQRERLTYIWNKIRDAYKLYGTENKLATLKASMFTSTDKPHQEKPFLRTKAGECKSLAPVFATLAIELHGGDKTSDLLVQLFTAMEEFCQILDMEGMFPSEAKCEEAVLKMATFNATYQELQRTRYNDHMWHTVGKFHNAKHMAASFKWMNPRFNWCFRAEDYVGRIAKLSWSCAFGCKVLNLTKKTTEKYKLMMFIRFWKHSTALHARAAFQAQHKGRSRRRRRSHQ